MSTYKTHDTIFRALFTALGNDVLTRDHWHTGEETSHLFGFFKVSSTVSLEFTYTPKTVRVDVVQSIPDRDRVNQPERHLVFSRRISTTDPAGTHISRALTEITRQVNAVSHRQYPLQSAVSSYRQRLQGSAS